MNATQPPRHQTHLNPPQDPLGRSSSPPTPTAWEGQATARRLRGHRHVRGHDQVAAGAGAVELPEPEPDPIEDDDLQPTWIEPGVYDDQPDPAPLNEPAASASGSPLP
jgi:hypothetical protein